MRNTRGKDLTITARAFNGGINVVYRENHHVVKEMYKDTSYKSVVKENPEAVHAEEPTIYPTKKSLLEPRSRLLSMPTALI